MSRLTFTPGNHTYWLRDTGTGKKSRVPSVTTLLSQLDKPALKRWAANTAADYAVDYWDDLASMPLSQRRSAIAGAPWQASSKAAAKGTAIHSLAESLLAGVAVEVPDELRSKVEGLARWIEASGIAIVQSESMVWSEPDDELGLTAYAGTFDALARHPRYGLTLIDWKTGNGVYGEYAVQLAAYAAAEFLVDNDSDTDERMPRVDALAVAHVRADGTDLHVLHPDDRVSAAQRFELLRMLRTVPEPTFQMEATA